MREGARRVIITVSALALIGITVFCISGTVHSSEKVERREREKYYREIATLSCASTACAVSASGNWPIRARSPA